MFADSEDELQRALDVFQDNCNIMKLTVNVSKTKIVIHVFTNEKKLTIYVSCSNHSLWK